MKSIPRILMTATCAALLLPLSPAAAATIASGKVTTYFSHFATTPEVAQFVAEGCATNVREGVQTAVIKTSQYAGRTLRITVPGATRLAEFGPPTVTVAVRDDCSAGLLRYATTANTSTPGTFEATGGYAVIFNSNPETVDVRYTLSTV